jgi:hypothetical protein
MERIPVSGEAYDPISMTTIITNLTKKILTKQFPGEGFTVTVPRCVQNGSESLGLKALENFDVGIGACLP